MTQLTIEIPEALAQPIISSRLSRGLLTLPLNFSNAIRCGLTMPCSWLPLASLIAHGLPPLIFVTGDDRLITVTRGEGMTAENPNLHS
jgi:hypothetical protein